MKEPVDHIIRPILPWRSEEDLQITECGHDSSKVQSITRDQFMQRLKDCGEQRTALLTCMTCISTSKRWKSWEESPVEAVGREVEWESGWRRRKSGDVRLKNELLAIQSLIENHKDEFEGLVKKRYMLDDWLKRKSESAKPVKPKPKQKW